MTPANLMSHLHRSLESSATAAALRAIFPSEHFAIHDALPATNELADEGAANHTRLCLDHGGPGIELFTYGRDPAVTSRTATRYTPRQSRTASQAIARLHTLHPSRTFFVQQSAEAINAGVFHNDVIALGHRQVFLYHERAYAETASLIESLRRGFGDATGGDLLEVAVPEKILPLTEAVASYLFNSQLVTLPGGSMAMILPIECREIPFAAAAVDYIRARVPTISVVHYVDVRQSMHNGGGPACLRLRVVLTAAEQGAIHRGVIFTPALYEQLKAWISRHYRDELRPEHLADPKLLAESQAALDELTTILKLRALYPFQR
jgi:succinylarginine dihydrolase